MKKVLLIFLLLVLNLTVFAKDEYRFVKNIEVKKGDVFAGNIVSVEGKIIINGNVSDSIIILGGEIELNGEVTGDVICIASIVKIKHESKIGGDLIILGEAPQSNEGKVVGAYHLFELNLDKIRKTILPLLTGSNNFFIINLIKTVLWFILILIVFFIFSDKIYMAESIVNDNLKKIALISLIGIIIFILLLILFIFFSFLIIGIPFLLGLFIFYFIALTFGRTVLLYFIGEKIFLSINKKNIPPVLYLFIGFMIYAVLLFVPGGKFILLIINIFEFGIGLSYFFRRKLKF